MSRVPKGPLSPHTPNLPLRIIRIEKGAEIFVRILSNEMCGLFTHYLTNGSVYCPGDRCECANRAKRRIWKGYLLVEAYDQAINLWAPGVLEVTEYLEQDLRGQWDRGQVWRIWRETTKPKGGNPLRGQFEQELDANLIPKPFCFKAVLQHLYHTTAIATHHKNPLPGRIVTTFSEGEAPAGLAHQEPPAQASTREEILNFREREAQRIEELKRQKKQSNNN